MKHHLAPLCLLAALVCLVAGFNDAYPHGAAGVAPEEALQKLRDGNARFVSGRLSGTTPDSVEEGRKAVAQGQKPFAIIVGCSDSRVGPELVFDQKVGDLFVIRTAGEVVDPVALGSIEYAVAHLGSRLIVVLGHQRCGAVAAAVADAKEPGHIATVLKAIQPAVRETKGEAGDPVENAVRAQARDVAEQLRSSGPILKEAVESGKIKVVAAYYNLDTGKVVLLPEEHK